MNTFNLKEVFNHYGWSEGFKFEIIFSKSGTARIYINDRKTKYSVGGYGYDKISSVIAIMINDLIGEQPYNRDIYGNSGNYDKVNTLFTLSGGVGFSSIKESFESIEGNKLISLYSGLNSNVYEVVFSKNKTK